tara:strand:- start:383 stop:865 length:483 start_codon:yes stop_codon:yes gene_type:complete
MKNKTYYLLTFYLISLGGIYAQQAILSSGGNASGNGGTSSYSIGQIFYETNNGSKENIVQGVQQPFEISAVLGLEEPLDISYNFLVYPNPTTDFLNLTISQIENKKFIYQVFDLNGRLLFHKKMENNNSEIRMNQLANAVYLLKIFENKKLIKIFKIIKN